jgi:hypothetical protein
MFTRHLWCISLAAAIVGCGGHTLDIGSTDGGAGSGDLRQDAGAGGPAGPVWNGTLENAQLSNGSNRLTMTLSVGPDGGATGTLLLGDGALLPPATDPNVGYPPGAEFSPFPGGGTLGLFEGFAYTMLDGHLSGSELTFRVAEVELWTRWCALQTPYPALRDSDGTWEYLCVQNWGWGGSGGPMGCALSDPTTMQDIPIDCGKVSLCNSYACNCSATACRVSSFNESGMSFDLVLTGMTADGAISGELGNHGVHFVQGQ